MIFSLLMFKLKYPPLFPVLFLLFHTVPASIGWKPGTRFWGWSSLWSGVYQGNQYLPSNLWSLILHIYLQLRELDMLFNYKLLLLLFLLVGALDICWKISRCCYTSFILFFFLCCKYIPSFHWRYKKRKFLMFSCHEMCIFNDIILILSLCSFLFICVSIALYIWCNLVLSLKEDAISKQQINSTG